MDEMERLAQEFAQEEPDELLELMRERAEKAEARVQKLSHELERYSAFQYEKYMEELKASQDRVQKLEAQLAHWKALYRSLADTSTRVQWKSDDSDDLKRCKTRAFLEEMADTHRQWQSQYDQKIKAAERVAELEEELLHRDLMDDGEYRRLDVRLKEAEALLSRTDASDLLRLLAGELKKDIDAFLKDEGGT
jgi:hypothetical protein